MGPSGVTVKYRGNSGNEALGELGAMATPGSNAGTDGASGTNVKFP